MKCHRLYVNQHLFINKLLLLEGRHFVHYLQTVLRLKVKDKIRIFNDNDGEYLGEIFNFIKSEVYITITSFCRKTTNNTNLMLGLCLTKASSMMTAVSMSVQLGIAHIVPIVSERSQYQVINESRVRKCILESVEQSERVDIPNLISIINLKDIDSLNSEIIIYANTNADHNNTILKLKSILSFKKILLVIGPEGGFSSNEIIWFNSLHNSYSISLGPNILRVETAVCTAIVQLQMIKYATKSNN